MLVGRSSWSKISNSAPAESLFGGVIRAGRCNSSPGLSLEPAKGSEAGGAPGLLHGALACPAATSNSPRFAVWDERRRVPKGVLTSGLLVSSLQQVRGTGPQPGCPAGRHEAPCSPLLRQERLGLGQCRGLASCLGTLCCAWERAVSVPICMCPAQAPLI